MIKQDPEDRNVPNKLGDSEETIIADLKAAYKQINKIKKSTQAREIKLDIERRNLAEKMKKE